MGKSPSQRDVDGARRQIHESAILNQRPHKCASPMETLSRVIACHTAIHDQNAVGGASPVDFRQEKNRGRNKECEKDNCESHEIVMHNKPICLWG